MDPTVAFCLHAAAAALMGTAIGVERHWNQHPAGLRTNALVAFGADLFVSLPHLLGGSFSPAQVAGQVVTGVGFLGGGVILREGMNVRGMNTAATLWCSAAVGALCGAGLLLPALAGAVGVLGLHLALRPLGLALDRRMRTMQHVETYYRLRVICKAGQEAVTRANLLKFFHDHTTMVIQGVTTQDCGMPDRVSVNAEIRSDHRDDRGMEELMAFINDEPSALSVSWEKNPAA